MMTTGRWRTAVLLPVVVAAAVALFGWCRPASLPMRADDPTSGVVLAAAWIAWAFVGYLLLAAVVAAAAGLPAPCGRAMLRLAPFVPPALHRLVAAAAGAAVLTGVTAPDTASAATATPLATTAIVRVSPPSPLDWPAAAPPTEQKDDRPIVVRPGDSLWSLSARLLGPAAAPPRVATTWPLLYAANRAVIGADPDLIHPGQRLVPPSPDERTPR